MAHPISAVQVSHEVMQQIRAGVWSIDQPLPPERELAKRWQVSRNTIRSALKRLEDRGLLSTVHGGGRRIRPHAAVTEARIGLLTRGGTPPAHHGAGYRCCRSVEVAARVLGHSVITFAINTQMGRLIDTDNWRPADFDVLDGAVVLALQYTLEDIRRMAKQMPVVVMLRDASEVGAASFYIDLGLHAAVAVQELVKLGHQRIALFMEHPESHRTHNTMVRRGFDLGRKNAGLPLAHDAILPPFGTGDDDGHVQLYRRWRDEGFPFSAAVSILEEPLARLTTAARQDGQYLPDHLSMVCLSDLSQREGMVAPFAFFLAPIEQIGDDAVHCLHDMLHGVEPRLLDNPYYGNLTPADTFRPPAPRK